jgi:hypothetical protein
MFFMPEVALLLRMSFEPHHTTIESFQVSVLISVDAVLVMMLDETPDLMKPQTSKLGRSWSLILSEHPVPWLSFNSTLL